MLIYAFEASRKSLNRSGIDTIKLTVDALTRVVKNPRLRDQPWEMAVPNGRFSARHRLKSVRFAPSVFRKGIVKMFFPLAQNVTRSLLIVAAADCA